MSDRARTRFRAKHIGFVFQQYNLLPALTAAENAAIPLVIAGWSKTKAVDRAKEVLASLGMGKKTESLPNQLSGGQQQRVAISRALVHEPSLLVCDEPTAALDHETGLSVMELLREAAVKPDRAVVVVTHDNRVFHFGDRIAHMDDGRIVQVEDKTRVAADLTADRLEARARLTGPIPVDRPIPAFLANDGDPRDDQEAIPPAARGRRVWLRVFTVVKAREVPKAAEPPDARRRSGRSSEDRSPARGSSRPGWRTSRSARRCRAWSGRSTSRSRTRSRRATRSSGSTTATSGPSWRSARRTSPRRSPSTSGWRPRRRSGDIADRRGRRRGGPGQGQRRRGRRRPGPSGSIKRQMGTASDYDKDRFAFQAAKASLAKAQADLNRLKITWEADKQVAKAAVAMADSQLESTKIQLERLVVRALADGEILQVNVRPGQFAAAVWNQALVVIGDSKRLHVRVDIDENDVPLFDPKRQGDRHAQGTPGRQLRPRPRSRSSPTSSPRRA